MVVDVRFFNNFGTIVDNLVMIALGRGVFVVPSDLGR